MKYFVVEKEYLIPEEYRQTFKTIVHLNRPQDQILLARWDDVNLINMVKEENVEAVIILEGTSDMSRMVKNFLIGETMSYSDQEVINIGWPIKEFAKKMKDDTGCLVFVARLPLCIGSASICQLSSSINDYLIADQEIFGEVIDVMDFATQALVNDALTYKTKYYQKTRGWWEKNIISPVVAELAERISLYLPYIENLDFEKRFADLPL